MRKASREPVLSDSARWLGMSQESPEEHWWDDLLDRDPDSPIRVRLLTQLAYLDRIGVRPDRDMLVKMIDEAKARAERFAWEPPTSVTVYYLRVGSLIKIGQTTQQLSARLQSYPPDAVLLATEIGEPDALEQLRLSQFAHCRADLRQRREWFYPSAELIEHINSLRDEPLTAAELGA